MTETNLTNCDVEPIHIPGKVQSHGFLVAVNAESYTINYVSDNTTQHLDINPKDLLGQNIVKLNDRLQEIAEDVDLVDLLKLGARQNGFDTINPYKIKIKEQPFYLIIHKSNGSFVLEFEVATLEYDIQNIIGKAVSEILVNKSLDTLLKKAAQEVKSMIEYDRIMIYKFHEDGHGEVVSEVKNDDLEPFFGLHYPASDIPKQARELYKLNLTRIIADVNIDSIPISTTASNKPLDLTQSTLRAVSPIHIEYLKNMGVASSFSISLISQGELWGLIACHNYSPKFIDFKAREGCKLIGNILSSALEYRQVEENSELQNHYTNRITELTENLERDKVIVNALTGYPTTLLDIV
ncbi:MAG: GAF domain-containing protein, partial [Flavobacterium sp.]